MNGGSGIVVRSVAAWLRRRGWIVVEPSGVGAIADGFGAFSFGGASGPTSEAPALDDVHGHLRRTSAAWAKVVEDAGRLQGWSG